MFQSNIRFILLHKFIIIASGKNINIPFTRKDLNNDRFARTINFKDRRFIEHVFGPSSHEGEILLRNCE